MNRSFTQGQNHQNNDFISFYHFPFIKKLNNDGRRLGKINKRKYSTHQFWMIGFQPLFIQHFMIKEK